MSWNGGDESMQGFVDKHGLTFPNVNDDEGVLFSRFGVPSQPAWAFVDRQGEVCVGLGAIPDDELDRVLGELEADAFSC